MSGDGSTSALGIFFAVSLGDVPEFEISFIKAVDASPSFDGPSPTGGFSTGFFIGNTKSQILSPIGSDSSV
jgi:hypothetical protein